MVESNSFRNQVNLNANSIPCRDGFEIPVRGPPWHPEPGGVALIASLIRLSKVVVLNRLRHQSDFHLGMAHDNRVARFEL